eukprot:1160010-Pelagomonas_calceolata.AAC.7
MKEWDSRHLQPTMECGSQQHEHSTSWCITEYAYNKMLTSGLLKIRAAHSHHGICCAHNRGPPLGRELVQRAACSNYMEESKTHGKRVGECGLHFQYYAQMFIDPSSTDQCSACWHSAVTQNKAVCRGETPYNGTTY